MLLNCWQLNTKINIVLCLLSMKSIKFYITKPCKLFIKYFCYFLCKTYAMTKSILLQLLENIARRFLSVHFYPSVKICVFQYLYNVWQWQFHAFLWICVNMKWMIQYSPNQTVTTKHYVCRICAQKRNIYKGKIMSVKISLRVTESL